MVFLEQHKDKGVSIMHSLRILKQIKNGEWEGLKKTIYKPDGSHFSGTTRTILYTPSESEAGFEVRYFEIKPGGYTSLEKHRHIHFVISKRGEGEVKIGRDWQMLTPNSIALIPPNCPHQLRNNSDKMFGFYCIVDHLRDKPIELLKKTE